MCVPSLKCFNPPSVLVSLNPSTLTSLVFFLYFINLSCFFLFFCLWSSAAALNLCFCLYFSIPLLPPSLQVGANLNHDEVVVYNEDAAIPTYLIVYSTV